MAQKIADRLERKTGSQEKDCIRVPQAMDTLERNGQAASLRPSLKCLGNRCRFEYACRSAVAEKQLAKAAWWISLEWRALQSYSQCGTTVTNIVKERVPHLDVYKRQGNG